MEDEKKSEYRAKYGKRVLKDLTKRLTTDFGKGFSRANLQWMRLLYIKYPICQTLSSKLSWSHYCELLTISDDDKRSFYEQECINAHWSFRELKRQIDCIVMRIANDRKKTVEHAPAPHGTHPLQHQRGTFLGEQKLMVRMCFLCNISPLPLVYCNKCITFAL